jgi:dTDP-4-amino-4,6-dideoxygalactose transaminase
MIPFIDLERQYRSIQGDIDAAIKTVLSHGKFILGPEVSALEDELAAFAGSRRCLGCSNGTDALSVALMALDVKAGDAVFTTPFTFFATVETIALRGAVPVFADIDLDTYNMDPAKLREAIVRVEAEGKLKPKAIISVDLFGLCADYAGIEKVAEEFGLPVIEDAAQAFGAVRGGRRAPSFGKIGCTSFFPAKPLGCYGDGGAIFTDDDGLYSVMHSLIVHGRGSDKYDNVRLGLNARLDTLQAAILLQKLKIYPEEIELRQKVADAYLRELSGFVKTPVVPEGCVSVWAQFCVMSPRFEKIQAKLKDIGVPTARYYPIPMHLLKAMEYLGYKKGSMPLSEKAAEEIFALPMHPYLDEAEIARIGETVRSACR